MNGFHMRSIRSLAVVMARSRPEARSARPRLSILVSLLALGAFTASCSSSQTSSPTGPTSLASLASHSGNVDLPVPVVSDAGVCGQLTLTWTNVAVDGHTAQSWHLEIWELVLGVRIDPKVFNEANYVGNPTPESLTLALPPGTYEVRITAKSSLSGVKNSANASYFFTVTACSSISSEACSPGFWKNHAGDYADGVTALGTGDFHTLFGLTTAQTGLPAGWTLQDALDNPGGNSPGTNPNNANFIGAGAILSAAHADVTYPYTQAEVVAAVQAAYGIGAPDVTLDDLKATFESGHVCPLG